MAVRHSSLATTAHTGGEPIDASCVAGLLCCEAKGDIALPTVLPQRRRNDQARTTARLVFDIVFNGALLVSALMLTVVVLVKAQIAFGQAQFAAQTTQRMMDASSEGRAMAPSE